MARRPAISKKAIQQFNKLVRDYLAPYLCSPTELGISDKTRIVTFYGTTWAAVDVLDEEEGSELFTVFLRLCDPSLLPPEALIAKLGINTTSGKWNFHVTGDSSSVQEAFDQFCFHFHLMLPIRRDISPEVFLANQS